MGENISKLFNQQRLSLQNTQTADTTQQQNTQLKNGFSLVTQSSLTLCDPMNCSPPGLPVHHQLPESTQTHVH